MALPGSFFISVLIAEMISPPSFSILGTRLANLPQRSAYLTASLASTPPGANSVIATFSAVSPQAPISPVVRHSRPVVMPNSSAMISTSAVAAAANCCFACGRAVPPDEDEEAYEYEDEYEEVLWY